MLKRTCPVASDGRCASVPTGNCKLVTLSIITISLLIVSVPVVAPMLIVVASPNASMRVALVLNTLNVPVSSVIMLVPLTCMSLSATTSLSAVTSTPACMLRCVLRPPVICTAPVTLSVASSLFSIIIFGVVPNSTTSDPSTVSITI